MTNSRPFDTIHPALQLGYFAALLALTMLCMHPVLLLISFMAALGLSIFLSGTGQSLRALYALLFLIVLCTVINPLFSMRGSVELFRIASHAIYLESLVYGACMGLMLAAVILWFNCATALLNSSKIMAVLTGPLPTLALMLSMALRLVPKLMTRGRLILQTLRATTSPKAGMPTQAADYSRMVSVLMGWSFEDSLESANAMKARGYGATKKRSNYQRYRFVAHDAQVALLLFSLVLASGTLAYIACSQYRFFPALPTLSLWWGYIVYATAMFLPLIFGGVQAYRMRQVKR